jgi:ParB-like chromosome segregation protein Spo0J
MQESLKIEYVDIDSIKPYENNTRLHSNEQIEQIKSSIEEFGNNDPIGVWHDEIVEGHGRYQALKELGYKEIPIIRLDNLTDEQRKAYSIVHNKLTDNSEFDFSKLDEELENLKNLDLSQYGLEIEGVVSSNDLETPSYEEEEPNLVTCPNCQCEFEV